MQRRQVADAGIVTVGTFSLAGWLLPALFQAIGWVEWAQGLSAVFDLFADPRISWPGIYVFLTIGAIATGAVTHWPDVAAWRKRRVAAKQRTWNTSFDRAAHHVAYRSHFSDNLSRDRLRIIEAGMALMEAARNGQIILGGCANDSLTPKAISVRELRCLKISCKDVQTDAYHWRLYDVKLVKEGAAEAAYDKLFFDRTDIFRTWPAKADS